MSTNQMCVCASLLLADRFFFSPGGEAKPEFSTIRIPSKCFPMTFVHILVTARLTRARSVVVELYLPFCGLHICKQASLWS